MALSHAEFVADVAAVFIQEGGSSSFGSGRLIAPGLVLSARHVVNVPSNRLANQHGAWSVRLLRNRTRKGQWDPPVAYRATVVWPKLSSGGDDLDLALLRIEDERPTPRADIVFSRYDLASRIDEVTSAGFPQARYDLGGRSHDYTVYGKLGIAESGSIFEMAIEVAPDDPVLWRGMSGAAVCHTGEAKRLHVFGVVLEVPARFSQGVLKVAPLSDAFRDEGFLQQIGDALGEMPSLRDWPESIAPRRSSARKHPRLGQLVDVPTLPSHYIRRERQIAELKKLLGIEPTAGVRKGAVSQLVAICGAGGGGKTLLALDTAREADVRRHFHSGIYRFRLGDDWDWRNSLEEFLEALTQERRRLESRAQARNLLARAVEGKSVLLIADDVRNLRRASTC